MGVQLVAGYRAAIQIKDHSNHLLYEKLCASDEEVKSFVATYGKSKKGENIDSGVVVPLRTRECRAFTSDLFCPMLNRAIKIKNVCMRVFLSFCALLFDAATFPLRLIAAPFRACYQRAHPEKEHPLISLIKNSPRAKEAVRHVFVSLHYQVESTQIGPPGLPDDEGISIIPGKQKTVKGTVFIALKRWPGPTSDLKLPREEERVASYIGYNGEWILDTALTGTSSHYKI